MIGIVLLAVSFLSPISLFQAVDKNISGATSRDVPFKALFLEDS